MQDARQSTGTRKMPRSILEKKPSPPSLQQAQFQRYQAALQWMQEGKYDKAQSEFEQIAREGSLELKDRAALHLAACQRQTQKHDLAFNSIEERYDYAISQLNSGNYEDAREHLEAILVEKEEADYAHYGVAVLNSMTGQAEDCLQHLSRAIELNPQNRILARRDSDFSDMADDPRFTELLYPEVY
jgi:tetratricopeptide (TPR) repeat protein